MPPSTKKAEEPSPLDVATLAARFLPRIELPNDWQSQHPETLKAELARPTGTPFPHNPQHRPDPGWRLQWEVVCEEAVKRARILLDAAAGKVRPEVAEWDAATMEASQMAREMNISAEKLKRKFDRIAKGRHELPLLEVLRFCLPKTRSDEARMFYFTKYLELDCQEYNRRHGIPGAVSVPNQADRMVSRHEFPILVRVFRDLYQQHKEAWPKAWARCVGKAGREKQIAQQEAIASREGVAVDLSKNEAMLIDEAAERHGDGTAKKKNARK